VSRAPRATAVALAGLLVVAAFLGGRAIRSDDGGSTAAPAAEFEQGKGKGEGLGTAAALPRLRRDPSSVTTGTGGDAAATDAPTAGPTSNNSTQETQAPTQTQKTKPPPADDTESFGGGTD
jgi:hypothetical protein